MILILFVSKLLLNSRLFLIYIMFQVLSIIRLSSADVSHLNSATASQYVNSNGIISSHTSLSTNNNGVLAAVSRNSTNQLSREKPNNLNSLTSFSSIKTINQNILPPKTFTSPPSAARPTKTVTTRGNAKIKFTKTLQQVSISNNFKSKVPSSTESSSKISTTKSSQKRKLIDNSGKYTPDLDKWAYKPDKSGKYKHVDVPYDGGYGPWTIKKIVNYDHDGRRYEHDDHPFNNQFYSEFLMEYLFPFFQSEYFYSPCR